MANVNVSERRQRKRLKREAVGDFNHSFGCLHCERMPDPEDSSDPKLMHCKGCRWAGYCNSEHQRADWKRHKGAECQPIVEGVKAGKKVSDVLVELQISKAALNPARTLINYEDGLGPLPSCSKSLKLEQCWPLFAIAVEAGRAREEWPVGEWCNYYIEKQYQRPDRAVVICYAKATQTNNVSRGYEAWHPTAPKHEDVGKLLRRLHNTGFALENALAVALAVRETMYENDYGFTLFNKAISDFGVCAGSLRIDPEDILYAIRPGETKETKYHYPLQDHYWLYFTAADGETVRVLPPGWLQRFLTATWKVYYDFSLNQYQFHLCPIVRDYLPDYLPPEFPSAVPGYQQGRMFYVSGPRITLHHERSVKSRFSVAQDPRSSVIANDIEPASIGEKGRHHLLNVCEEIRDGMPQDNAPDMLSVLATLSIYNQAEKLLANVISSGSYKRFPPTVSLAIVDEN